MNRLLLIIFLSISVFSFGQTYRALIKSADEFYNLKDYKKSIDLYQQAFKLEAKSADDFYNAACAAALGSDKKLALKWLTTSIDLGWGNVNHLKTDKDLNSLHNSKQWPSLLAKAQATLEKREAKYNKPLQAELIAIYNDDQSIRRQFMAAIKKFGQSSKQVDSLGRIMLYQDSINQIKVLSILDQHGWVGPDIIGGQANQTLFLVIQHADLKIQQKYLPMMREAVAKNNASKRNLALLEDRVALGEGRKQTYGSQIGWNKETDESFVLPLEDPDHVDERRESMGLDPLAEYLKNFDLTWDVEEYKKQLPKFEEWHKANHQ